ARGAGIGFLVVLDLLERGQADHRITLYARCRLVGGVDVVGWQFAEMVGDRAEQGDAADRFQVARAFALGETVGHFDDGAFGIAVDQKVGLGVGQDRAAHLVGPIVVMGDAAERSLDAPEHDGDVLIGLAAALGVDDGAAIGPFAALAAGRIGV